jgi:competence protein ComEC
MLEQYKTSTKKYWLLVLTLLLLAANVFLVRLDWQNSHRGLTFAMLDVGQGDGLFIESPVGTQIIFDAGPAHKVLGPLSRVMSPFDKSIDAIVITNPDADHISGILDILKNYKVGEVFEPGTLSDSKTFQNLKMEIKNQSIPDILAKKGMRLNIGGGAFIDILFPDRDVSVWATNDGSTVARLYYGSTSIMLAGDSTMKTEKIILSENSPAQLKSTILKVGHHGSRTSTSGEFVKAVSPSYAFISDGKDNNYGHPHQETLDTLAQFGAEIFRTDLLGTIIIKSDSQNILFSFDK